MKFLQKIYEVSKLKYNEVFSDFDMVLHTPCSSEKTTNFKKCPENSKENLLTHPKLNHSDALVYTESLINWSKKIKALLLKNLRNLSCKISQKVNENLPSISFFTRQ